MLKKYNFKNLFFRVLLGFQKLKNNIIYYKVFFLVFGNLMKHGAQVFEILHGKHSQCSESLGPLVHLAWMKEKLYNYRVQES